ncbi:ubiquitin-conjugating enzyme E2 T isoform X2 [Anabrus simplex]|uniref:ubiquitin-conjugating enzyme E2 T isoform X2 n=1 Tax=Anabrus simplex TaxID=316456 RepID=UPI0034DCF12C
MDNARFMGRIRRELAVANSVPGIFYCCKNEKMDELEATISGLEGTPYEGGIFQLKINIPEKYPLVPPRVQFVTPVYHPNIDSLGRICLDILRHPPKGSWSPVTTITGVLLAIQVLMGQPNPDDPLMHEIAEQYLYHKRDYVCTAKEWTKKYAVVQSTDVQSRREESEDQNVNLN